MADQYEKLIALLDQNLARYRVIDHSPEGRTELVSPLRGNALSDAAKCIVLMVKQGKKITRHVLGIVPGDALVDLDAVKSLLRGTYVSFARSDVAEELAGSISGTILPFSFRPDLEIIADPALATRPEIYFNAARLDRSLALNTQDWLVLAKPRLEPIARRNTRVSSAE